MAGGKNWMIIKVPSSPTHSVTVQLTSKSRECTQSSSSSLFLQPGVHRAQQCWEWNNPGIAPGSCCWSRKALSQQQEEPASLAQKLREETQHTEGANTAPGSSSPCSPKPLHGSALCSPHCSSQVLPFMLGPDFQHSLLHLHCVQAAKTLSVCVPAAPFSPQ